MKSPSRDSNIYHQLFIKPSLEQNMIWQTNRSSPSVVERAVSEIIVGIQIQAQIDALNCPHAQKSG